MLEHGKIDFEEGIDTNKTYGLRNCLSLLVLSQEKN